MIKSIPKSKFLEGLKLCEDNSQRLFDLAQQAFKNREFIASFIIGFASWDEIGKAFLILENWDKGHIDERTWEKQFKSHYHKIKLARLRSDQYLTEDLLSNSMFKNVPPKIEIVLDEEHIKKVINARTDCLYVNYDFKGEKWKSPLEIRNPDELAALMICMVWDSAAALRREKEKIGLI